MEILTSYFERAREAGVQQEILKALSAVPLLECLNESQLVYLASQMQGRAYEPHERIFELGSAGHELHVVLEGQTELREPADGGERLVATAVAGQSFGEIGFLTGEPRSLAAVNGAVPGLHLVLSAFDFERVMALSPDVGQAIYRRLLEVVSGRMKGLPAAGRTYLMWGYGNPLTWQTAPHEHAGPAAVLAGLAVALAISVLTLRGVAPAVAGTATLGLVLGLLLAAAVAALEAPRRIS